MKQSVLWDLADHEESRYTTAAGSPLYVPSGGKPDVRTLVDKAKARELIARVNKSNVSEEEKAFLTAAAYRHMVFNYERCANYYAHATPEMQRLMEESALVIPDINSAIENGYVQLCDSIKKLYMEEVLK